MRVRSILLAFPVVVALAACDKTPPKSEAPKDPTEVKCAPHRKRELDCADEEKKQALVLVGDMCQKVLNGKNTQFFGPRAQRTMERELKCAIDNQDCAAYAACKARGEGDGDSDAAPP